MSVIAKLEGEHAGHDVTDVVREILARRWTGTLILGHEGAARTLEWQRGRLAGAASTHPDDRLVDLLLRDGRIRMTEHSRVVAAGGSGQGRGDLLVEMGILSADLVQGAHEELAELIVCRCLSSSGWRCWTHPGAGDETEPTGPLARRTLDLVVEAIHHVESWPRVEAAVGGSQAQYVRADRYEELLGEMRLSFERMSVITELHGVKSAEAICLESTLPDFDVFQLLWAFRTVGAVRRLEKIASVPTEIEDEGLEAVLGDEDAEEARIAPPPAPAPGPDAAGAAAGPGRKRILLLGLSDELLASIEPMLSRSSFEVERATGAAAAFDAAATRPFDLMLVSDPSDLPLDALLARVRREKAATHVVVAAEEADLSTLRRSLGDSAELAVLVREPRKLLEEVASRLLGVARRVSARLLVKLEVRIEDKKRLAVCQTENLSLTGMLVRTDQLLPLGTRVSLEFQLPDDRSPVLLVAEVMRHTLAEVEKLSGMGLVFVSFRGDTEKRLQHFVEKLGP